MIRRAHVVTTVICVVTLLTLGAGWFAFGQKTNTEHGLTPGMDTPPVRDVNLSKRVEVLEATVWRLENELIVVQKKSSK